VLKKEEEENWQIDMGLALKLVGGIVCHDLNFMTSQSRIIFLFVKLTPFPDVIATVTGIP
jgi:hypothetical protein